MTDLGNAPLPARGLFYSVLAHALFAVVVMAVPWDYWFPSPPHLITMQSQLRQEEALILPNLEPMGGGSAAPAPSRGPGHGAHQNSARAAAGEARAVKGVVYKGPQLIVSNPPNPDNFVQTIRQPDIPLHPKFPAPLPIAPRVSIAPVKPMPMAPMPLLDLPHAQPVAVPVLPLSVSQQLAKVEAPKLPLPAAAMDPLRKIAKAAPAVPELAAPPRWPWRPMACATFW